ncbi:MAG: hypothetical protein ACFFAS_00245 [Promethearchaeota archaeon]
MTKLKTISIFSGIMFIGHLICAIIILVLCNLIFKWMDWLGLAGIIVLAIILLFCVDIFILAAASEGEGVLAVPWCIFIAMIFGIGILITMPIV